MSHPGASEISLLKAFFSRLPPVHRSQVSAWVSGQEEPSYIVSRAELIPPQAELLYISPSGWDTVPTILGTSQLEGLLVKKTSFLIQENKD